MKYRTAKICIGVCQYHDESAYDWFKDSFEVVVTLAKSILDSCPETLECFDKSSHLPLLEFVVLKCRWLGIRYEAWLILKKIAELGVKPVDRAGIDAIGKRIMEKEHDVQIEEGTPGGVALFPLPPEEARVKDYTADARFADLVTTQIVDGEGPEISYAQRLLLRCGSYELQHTAKANDSGGQPPSPDPQHLQFFEPKMPELV
ncbi:C6 zinc finger domain protein [Colletotrichum tofieldiae]|nr:C6 zinc finger domain protein [Colletotrichum tofieldiae]